MQKNLELVKFNLTPNMSLELINFNNYKKELDKVKEQYNKDKNNKKLKDKIDELEKKLSETRDKFIEEFRLSNKDEIDKYLEIKKQSC